MFPMFNKAIFNQLGAKPPVGVTSSSPSIPQRQSLRGLVDAGRLSGLSGLFGASGGMLGGLPRPASYGVYGRPGMNLPIVGLPALGSLSGRLPQQAGQLLSMAKNNTLGGQLASMAKNNTLGGQLASRAALPPLARLFGGLFG